MNKYCQLTQRQRFIIQDLRSLGKNRTEIAKEIGVHRSTISRELKRNSNRKGGYRALGAQTNMLFHRRVAGDYRRKIDGTLKEIVIEKLNLRWSPQQISGRLKLEKSFEISHESIYRWIYKHAPDFRAVLRLVSRRRRGRKSRLKRHEPVRDRRSIETRSSEANKRTELGHWERDTMLGKRSGASLLVVVDRKSRVTRLKKVMTLRAEENSKATKEILAKEKHLNSMTNDNGFEFADGVSLEKQIKVKVFYTHPYSSWERGTVENINGLLRQFYPKKQDLTGVDDKDIKEVEDILNNRPRKTHDYQTPNEIHFSKKDKLIKSESTYKKLRLKRVEEIEKEYWNNLHK